MHYYELEGVVYQLSNPLNGGVRLPKAQGKRRYRGQAAQHLRSWLPEGSTVYTVVRSVARSGMSRQISVFCINGSEIKCIDWFTSVVLDWKLKDAICVQGCGMDMAYHLVEALSYALYGKGGALTNRRL